IAPLQRKRPRISFAGGRTILREPLARTSDRFPAVFLAGAENGVDDLLVEYRFLQREDPVAAALRRPRESLGLQPVLLGARKAEDLRLGMVLTVERDSLVVVEPGVEGRGDLDEAFVAVEDHGLTRRHLGREVEGQFEIAEIGADRGPGV